MGAILARACAQARVGAPKPGGTDETGYRTPVSGSGFTSSVLMLHKLLSPSRSGRRSTPCREPCGAAGGLPGVYPSTGFRAVVGRLNRWPALCLPGRRNRRPSNRSGSGLSATLARVGASTRLAAHFGGLWRNRTSYYGLSGPVSLQALTRSNRGEHIRSEHPMDAHERGPPAANDIHTSAPPVANRDGHGLPVRRRGFTTHTRHRSRHQGDAIPSHGERPATLGCDCP